MTARAEFKIAERIDATDMIDQVLLGITDYFERNFSSAIDQYRRAARLESHGNGVHGWLCMAYEAIGDYENALNEYEAYERGVKLNAEEISVKYGRYRSALAQNGSPGMWESMLADLRKTSSTEHYYDMARLCVRLHRPDEAFSLHTTTGWNSCCWTMPGMNAATILDLTSGWNE
jgi:tetratricopeptide (TPR) repeat protein